MCPILECTTIPESILTLRAMRWFVFCTITNDAASNALLHVCERHSGTQYGKQTPGLQRTHTFNLSDVAEILLKVLPLTSCAKFPASLLLRTWDESSNFPFILSSCYE